jgi:hypothetical protein
MPAFKSEVRRFHKREEADAHAALLNAQGDGTSSYFVEAVRLEHLA